MAYRRHKEETPQLRIKAVKSNQQTALTREMEKTRLLSRAQRTLQVGGCPVNRDPLPAGWTEDHSIWELQGSITTQPTEAEKWG